MIRDSETKKRSLIEAVEEQARRRGVSAPLTMAFLRRCFDNVAHGATWETDTDGLLETGLSLLEFARERERNIARIAVTMASDAPEAGPARGLVRIVVADMPFLVDSVAAVLSGFGLESRLLVHPVVAVTRDAAGRMTAIGASENSVDESMIHVEVEGDLTADRLGAIAARLRAVLDDVRAVFEDTAGMRTFANEIARQSGQCTDGADAAQGPETAAFIEWLQQGAFVFLGSRAYGVGDDELNVEPGSGRGLLRDETFRVFGLSGSPKEIAADTRAFLDSPRRAMVSRSNHRSSVHRPVLLDVVLVKCIGANGRVGGLHLLLGLFTPTFHHAEPGSIPLLRQKIEFCEERSGFVRGGHDWSALQRTLAQLPRDLLLQVDADYLLETVLAILRLERRPRTALFALHDPCSRFATCMVYLDRDRFSAEVRARMASILEQAFDAHVVSDMTSMEHARLARIDFVLALDGRQAPQLDLADLERRLTDASRAWRDKLSEALAADPTLPADARVAYATAFPLSYTERFTGQDAVRDILNGEALNDHRPIVFALREQGHAAWRLKLYRLTSLVPLSDVLPMLENAGWRVINESAFELRRAAKPALFIQEFELEAAAAIGRPSDLAARMDELFSEVWAGRVEDDRLNALALSTRLHAAQIVVLRAYARLLRQVAPASGDFQVEDALKAHPALSERLLDLFETLFDPHADATDRDKKGAALARGICEALDAIESPSEDRILRSLLQLIQSSLRTSYFQRAADERGERCLSIKLASRAIDFLPLPRPLVEIFVYSPRVEGCHLRGDLISRGGLRWSDRRDDFRTEVLGLMKAQMVKNAVIVPRGSKGGFYVKRLPQREELQRAEVEACYVTFITALLALTDNIRGDEVVAPANLVRRDGDDPYLVVAADKGTATFSDLANEVAASFGFWLGDAFASGGTIGFDHKRMGITAKGAWEAVKRHFLEIGVDVQSEPFTCVGVGDMSGDVFGNGMLLSRQTKLVAAFDHRHIFIDPSPDCERSWTERKRLFDLPRSTWADYDRAALSPGGGIYPRGAKLISVSPEARELLGLASPDLPPAEIIKAILRAEVDLLWFGGIGTYVKASAESAASIGDRANDAVRVDATELRAKVVGEGANLAITQRARIEFALAGGRLNTDAVDNSAGVDTSDHEVNIKIAVGDAIRLGKLPAGERTATLRAMIGDVERLVLANNRSQTLALTIAELTAPDDIDRHMDMMKALEQGGILDRAVEQLPDAKEIGKRRASRRGLVRPELAVLVSYAKTVLRTELLATDLPASDLLLPLLRDYFPREIDEIAGEALAGHRLRREIVATRLANVMIDRMGPLFAWRLHGETNRDFDAIARAYLVVQDLFGLSRIWSGLESAAGVDMIGRASLLRGLSLTVERAVTWLLRSASDLAETSARLAPALRVVRERVPMLLPEAERQEFDETIAANVALGLPQRLAAELAGLETFSKVMDAVDISMRTGLDIADAVERYVQAGTCLGLSLLRRKAGELEIKSEWQRLAVADLVRESYAQQRKIVLRDAGSGNTLEPSLEDLLAEVERTEPPDLAMLTVAAGRIRTFVS